MTFDLAGLVIFALAVLPGFGAQQARYSIVPRSLKEKSALEETGDYLLNSVAIHLLCLVVFRAYLILADPPVLSALARLQSWDAMAGWARDNWLLFISYFLTSLIVGFFLGLFRGVLALQKPIRNLLARFRWYRWILENLGVPSFLEDDPVWHFVLRQTEQNEVVFLQVKLKDGGYFTGELKTYGIVDDSVKEKDFYLVNVHYRPSAGDAYVRVAADGVLLNSAEAESIEVKRGLR